ncbi:hypothetical protein V7S43_007618 [Phytophthora oleae]|uniref:Uncharacterized protein n=1 Tax=Phytophthora oleae TaxID=2107226 RepID=A0ABD3FLW3_9STRA
MDTVVNAVDVDPASTKKAAAKQSDGDIRMQDPRQEVSNPGIVATTERFAGIISELENKIADTP